MVEGEEAMASAVEADWNAKEEGPVAADADGTADDSLRASLPEGVVLCRQTVVLLISSCDCLQEQCCGGAELVLGLHLRPEWQGEIGSGVHPSLGSWSA